MSQLMGIHNGKLNQWSRHTGQQEDTRNTAAQFVNVMSSCSNADVPPVRAEILTQVCKALENARQVGVREDHP